MMSDWKECTIGEIASVKGGKRLPKGVNLITEQNAHPYIRIRDLTEKTLELKSSYEYVDNETQKCISRYLLALLEQLDWLLLWVKALMVLI